jgi:hypothetical protein
MSTAVVKATQSNFKRVIVVELSLTGEFIFPGSVATVKTPAASERSPHPYTF